MRGDDGSLTIRDIVAESGLMLGAGSAVLLQLARREVGLGVAEHSTTLDRPLDRLRTTVTYVYVMALGTPAEQAAVAAMVDRSHRGVRSPGRYSAYDPKLQLWVAATLTRSGREIYERLLGPLHPTSAQRLHEESAVYGTALQMPAEVWPVNVEEFDRWWEEQLDSFEPDPVVQAYVARLMAPSAIPWPLRWLAPLQSLVTRGNLDPRVRRVLGLAWTARDQRRYDLFWRIAAPVYRAVPRPLRQLSPKVTLAGMRLRMRFGLRVI
ncbi:oxygenase MpaB family protein [Nocardioides limicola]|uniref:oxygenase MpaB family protein n=1 Tax=Nocardioides limicola TaxID=2803368 RepID=UPI00193C7ED0|nr:oxygenase MpaB family protein [Nocardioides sp. DJM-14]